MHIPATTLPTFVTYNTFLYAGNNPAICCIFGYHGAYSSVKGNVAQQVQTYAYSSWVFPGVFRGVGIQDIDGLSHKISEGHSDPFINNTVPAWSQPGEPQYGCTSILEEGDPLVGSAYPITFGGYIYHPQNVPLLPWFSRQVPSLAVAGAYSWPDTTVLT